MIATAHAETADSEVPLWAQRMLSKTTGARMSQLGDDRVEVVLRVQLGADASRADGSAANPYPTIRAGMAAAVDQLAAGKPTKLLIGPGTYREAADDISTRLGQVRETLLIIEGAGPERTVWTGADVVAASEWQDIGNGVLATDWPHDFGHAAPNWGPPDFLAQRSEMLFVDDQMLRQKLIEPVEVTRTGRLRVGSRTGFAYERLPVSDPRDVLEPGSFGVAERDDSGEWSNRLFLRPESVSGFLQSAVEVSTRPTLLRIDGPKENLVLRGIAFTRARSHRLGGPIGPLDLDQMTDLLIDNCHFIWNNSTGLRLTGLRITIRNSRFDYNGDGGLNFDHNRHIRLEGNTTNFNNWRGHWGGYRIWAMGGIKFHHTEFNILKDHVAIGNLCAGIWYDIQCEHIYVENLVSAYNTRGLFLEIGNGPHFVDRSILAHAPNIPLHLMITGTTTVRNSIIYNGSDQAKTRAEREKERANTREPWQTPTPVFDVLNKRRESSWHATQRLVRPGLNLFENNVIAAGRSESMLAVIEPGLDYSEHNHAFKYVGRGNIFHLAGASESDPLFALLDAKPEWTKQAGDLADFRSWVDESDAVFANPAFANPSVLDFSIPANSPLARNKQLPTRAIDPDLVQAAADFFKWAEWGAFNDHLRRLR
ncbi:MAG: right-handed parallel beta-helix repeat-containing protein [Planctomycetota bacterium]